MLVWKPWISIIGIIKKSDMRRSLFLIVVSIVFSYAAFGQKTEPVNLTGVVLDAENLDPLPFTTILFKDGKTGTIADNSGYFSFLAFPGDTITFRSVGFQTSTFVIPHLLEGDTYSLIQMLVRESLMLDE